MQASPARTPPTRRPGPPSRSCSRACARGRTPARALAGRLSPARCSSRSPWGRRVPCSTPTSSPTWSAGGVSAPRCSRSPARSRSLSVRCGTLGAQTAIARHRSGRRRRRDHRSDGHQHRAGDRGGDRPRRLRRPHRRAGVRLLLAQMGEGRRRVPHAVHPRRTAGDRRGDRGGARLVVRPLGLAAARPRPPGRDKGRPYNRAMEEPMPATPSTPPEAGAGAGVASLDALAAVSAAVEAGAGLHEVVRAAGRALGAGAALLDASSSVLAVACRSPEEERAVLGKAAGSESLELRVAERRVGELRFRPRATPGAAAVPPADALLRMVGSVIALEVDRSAAPERATEAAVARFLYDVLNRRATDRENIVARGRELGADLAGGAAVLVVRAHAYQPEEGDWRARVLAAAERSARRVASGALAAAIQLDAGRRADGEGRAAARAGTNGEGEIVIVASGRDPATPERVQGAVLRELEGRFPKHGFAVARGRSVADPVDLHRAAAEALLAANVAEASGETTLAFEETGSYRLLLSAMSEDPGELERFYSETIAPLADYDEQYETALLLTLETYLDSDGSVAGTAQRLFTHRHTIRYRLERVRELTALDIGSSDGRERLSLGLKAMRVLGYAPPAGPATERGAEAGRVPRDEAPG